MLNKQANFDLTGKVAVVTGGTSGIGRAIALEFARWGADVIAVSRSMEKCRKTAEEIKARGRRTLLNPLDASVEEDVKKLRDLVIKEFGRIDILVNAAGINKKSDALLLDFADFENIMRTNCHSVFLTCKIFGQDMVKQKKGKIINIASMASFMGVSRSVAYTASKGAVNQMSKVLAIEWAPYNVQVNCIAPGFFETELTKPVFDNPESAAKIFNRTPMGRAGNVEELTGAAIYLASEASQFVTGSTLVVDGGMLAYCI